MDNHKYHTWRPMVSRPPAVDAARSAERQRPTEAQAYQADLDVLDESFSSLPVSSTEQSWANGASFTTTPPEPESLSHEPVSPRFSHTRTRGVSALSHTLPLGDIQGMLPENDGMAMLRRRILAVQNLDAPTNEKSRLVHIIMMEQYQATLSTQPHVKLPLTPSPVSQVSQDGPVTPKSSLSLGYQYRATSPQTLGSSMLDDINVGSLDRKPSFWAAPSEPGSTSRPVTPPESGKPSKDLEEGEGRIFGCRHYKRNVKLQCSECLRWYTCRFCHDEVESHAITRRATRFMLCMYCGCAQPAAGDCRSCGRSAACYYCDVCKFWDNEPSRSIYHCEDCGICRIGEGLGKDFYHCKVSGV